MSKTILRNSFSTGDRLSSLRSSPNVYDGPHSSPASNGWPRPFSTRLRLSQSFPTQARLPLLLPYTCKRRLFPLFPYAYFIVQRTSKVAPPHSNTCEISALLPNALKILPYPIPWGRMFALHTVPGFCPVRILWTPLHLRSERWRSQSPQRYSPWRKQWWWCTRCSRWRPMGDCSETGLGLHRWNR